MRRSHSTQAQLTASHCRLTRPTGEWQFTDGQSSLLWLTAKLLQGHLTGSRDIQNGWILSGRPSCVLRISPQKFCSLFIMSIRIWLSPFFHFRGCITLLHSVKGTNEHSHFVVGHYSCCFFPSPPARSTYSHQNPLLQRSSFMLVCFVHKPKFTIRTNQQKSLSFQA